MPRRTTLTNAKANVTWCFSRRTIPFSKTQSSWKYHPYFWRCFVHFRCRQCKDCKIPRYYSLTASRVTWLTSFSFSWKLHTSYSDDELSLLRGRNTWRNLIQSRFGTISIKCSLGLQKIITGFLQRLFTHLIPMPLTRLYTTMVRQRHGENEDPRHCDTLDKWTKCKKTALRRK
jgi:hypothetical protein